MSLLLWQDVLQNNCMFIAFPQSLNWSEKWLKMLSLNFNNIVFDSDVREISNPVASEQQKK